MPITHKRYLHTVSIVCRKYVSSKIHPTHENFPFHHYNSKYIFIYPHAHRKNIHQLSTTQSIPQPAATHHHSLIKHLHSPLPTSNIFFAEPQTLSPTQNFSSPKFSHLLKVGAHPFSQKIYIHQPLFTLVLPTHKSSFTQYTPIRKKGLLTYKLLNLNMPV